VAGWDSSAIATAKRIINKRAGFPTEEEWLENSFFAVPPRVVQDRFAAVIHAGLQTNSTFERNLPQELLRFVGDGPWE